MLLVRFALSTRHFSLIHSFGVNLKLTTTKFGLNKLETNYLMVQKAFRYDGQTDEQTEAPLVIERCNDLC